MATKAAKDSGRNSRETKTRRTHGERTELSDRLMLDAAEAMILELGTRDTTLKEVGERAGYSRGLAQARFGNKETLFLRLTERCRDNWIREMRAMAEGKAGIAALQSRIDAVPAYAKRFPDDARVLYILWFESVGFPSPMRQALAEFHEQARTDIEVLVSDAIATGDVDAGVNPLQFAMHFTSVLFGVSYQWVVNPDAVDIEAVLASIRENLLLLLRPQGS